MIYADETSRCEPLSNGRAHELPLLDEEEELKEQRYRKKMSRARKELEALKGDNAGRSEAERTALRRKIQTFLARNDEITAE